MTSLKALNPTVGSTVVIEIQSPRRKIVVEFLGFLDAKLIFVSAPKKKAGYSASSLEGKRVKVHIMLQGRICTLISKISKVMAEPLGYWHLEYPDIFEVSNLRKNARVDIQLPVAIAFQDTKRALKKELPSIVLCTDISMQGLGIEAPERLGEKGDEFHVTLRITIAGVDQLLMTPVQLRTSKAVEEGVYTHGFKFQTLETESSVLLSAFVYQKTLVNLGYIDE